MSATAPILPLAGPALREDVLGALGRAGAQMTRTLRETYAPDRVVPGLVWTVSDLAVHLVVSMHELTNALKGEPCAYDGAMEAQTTALVDDRLVATYPIRQLPALRERFAAGLATFRDVVASLPADHPVPAIAPHATALAVAAIFTVDYDNHGPQLAAAGGPPWTIDVKAACQCVAALVPAVYDRDAAQRRRARIELHLRGGPPLSLAVGNGTVEVAAADGRSPVDCHIVASPRAFLELTGGGFITMPRAAFTGQVVAYGWRPWAALALPEVMPPMNHGGKAPHRWL
jgi:hypothetical protein